MIFKEYSDSYSYGYGQTLKLYTEKLHSYFSVRITGDFYFLSFI